MLPKSAFTDPIWDSIGVEVWPLVAKSLGAQRLARQVSQNKIKKPLSKFLLSIILSFFSVILVQAVDGYKVS